MIDKFNEQTQVKTQGTGKFKEPTKNISCECLVVSEEIGRDRLGNYRIVASCLEHLRYQEKTSTKLMTDSQDRFHISGKKLSATNILHQITDDRPINTRQYRFPQIHKEKINR